MAKPVSDSVTYLKMEWKVKNIFSAYNQESEEFRFRTSLWRLAFEKITSAGTQRIRILLKETEARGNCGDFVSRVFVVDNNRTPQCLTEQVCKISIICFEGCVWWMDTKDLLQKGDILSTDDTVSFVCILMPKTTSEDGDGEIKPVQVSINSEAGSSVEAHLLDFRRLLDDAALSDVTLKCGDHTIPAHRNILSARSEVFAAMFRNDMAESRSGVIEVSDMNSQVLDQLIQFIYSCRLPDMSMDAATQLYEAADKYSVESLKTVCSDFISKNLSEGNACGILILADAHGDRELKDRVVSFILKTKLFLKDDIWLKFCDDHPKLAVGVLNRFSKSFSEFL